MRFTEIRALYFNWEYPLDARMYFQSLQRRLVEGLRRSIGNGLMTERGLARWAGVSQPHMHHILKGARALSPQIADRILQALQLTVIDLLELAQAETRPGRRPPGIAEERFQARLEQARDLRQQQLQLAGPVHASVPLSAGGTWPLPDRSPEPGAPPRPN